MKKLNDFVSYLFILPIVVSVLSNEQNNGNFYLTNCIIGVIVAVVSIIVLFNKQLAYNRFDFIIPTLLIYVISTDFFNDNKNITLYWALALYSVMFFLCKNLSSKITIRFVCNSYLVAEVAYLFRFIYQHIVLGFELTQFINNTFGNIGILCIFLTIGVIIKLCYLLNNRHITSNIGKVALAIVSCIETMVIVFLNNRTSIAIFIASALFIVLKNRGKNAASYIFLIIFVILSISLATIDKTDSSQGRLLIWCSSISLLFNSFPWGCGFNRFASIYPKYQADYCSSLNITDKEFFLADSTTSAFNEPLELICETGVLGISLILLTSYIVVKYLSRDKDLFAIVIPAIILCSFFFYVFHIAIFIIFITVLLAVCCHKIQTTQKIQYKAKYFVCIPIFIIGIFASTHFYKKTIALNKFEKIISGFNNRTEDLSALRTDLGDHPTFLLLYATQLKNNSLIDESLNVLHILNNRHVTYSSEILNGDCYFAQNNYSKAENHFRFAINLCPSKFLARHKLFELYKITDSEKASTEAKTIVDLPEKVPSATTLAIKLNAKEFFTKNKYKNETDN